MKNILYVFLTFSVFLVSCKNQDWEFPDFDYQTVYFAHQYPVRTITLGEDIYDNSLDNEWKFQIMATTGGVYESGTVNIDIAVVDSLANGLEFGNSGNEILAMPREYYTLASDQIVIPGGSVVGGVEVQLTSAFFADPLAIQNTYVIPVVMTNVSNADSILSGVPAGTNPKRTNPGDWAIQPKDFVLYAVKYINPWHGFYLRRGEDQITRDGVASTNVRHANYVEDDEVVDLSTLSMDEVLFPIDYQSDAGADLGVEVKLTFNDEQALAISPNASSYQVNDSVRVYNVEASGEGRFVEKGEKNSWGNKDRDALYLQYEVSFEVETTFPKVLPPRPAEIEQVRYNTVDTLVMRNRGVKIELFSPSGQ